jgi:hypothetical protein
MKIDTDKWNTLIENHYLSACKRNSEYSNKYTREEMKIWWYERLNKVSEKEVESFILGSIHANNNNYDFHIV